MPYLYGGAYAASPYYGAYAASPYYGYGSYRVFHNKAFVQKYCNSITIISEHS